MNAFALEDSRPCRSIEDLKQTQVRLTKTRQTLKLLKNIRPQQTLEWWTPRTHESPRELVRQSEAKRKETRQSEVNECRRRRIRLRGLPHFPSGIVERENKGESAWKSPNAKKDDTQRGERTHFSLSPPRVAFSRVGWFSHALALRSLYYPWWKMGDYS